MFDKILSKNKISNTEPTVYNLIGDRDIEWSWIAAQMPSGSGNALDFGNGGSYMGLIAAQKGYNVTALDLGEIDWPYIHPNLKFIKGDILKMQFEPGYFDLIINCSTVEHVGLAGRYNVLKRNPDGDLKAMEKLHAIMAHDGTMLLTIPVGQDTVVEPYHRIYGKARLSLLTKGYVIEKEAYWAKNNDNKWVNIDKDKAMNYEIPAFNEQEKNFLYALGCFVLKCKNIKGCS